MVEEERRPYCDFGDAQKAMNFNVRTQTCTYFADGGRQFTLTYKAQQDALRLNWQQVVNCDQRGILLKVEGYSFHLNQVRLFKLIGIVFGQQVLDQVIAAREKQALAPTSTGRGVQERIEQPGSPEEAFSQAIIEWNIRAKYPNGTEILGIGLRNQPPVKGQAVYNDVGTAAKPLIDWLDKDWLGMQDDTFKPYLSTLYNRFANNETFKKLGSIVFIESRTIPKTDAVVVLIHLAEKNNNLDTRQHDDLIPAHILVTMKQTDAAKFTAALNQDPALLQKILKIKFPTLFKSPTNQNGIEFHNDFRTLIQVTPELVHALSTARGGYAIRSNLDDATQLNAFDEIISSPKFLRQSPRQT